MQNLLLGLGTALIAAAAVVFMAVNWTQMGAVVQGLILLGITGLAGAATFAAARRQMPATAEAVGLATLMLALADCQALRVGLAPDVGATWFWAGAIGGLALGAWVLGAATRVRSTRVAAAVLGQVPLLILLGGLHPEATVAGIALLTQVGVVVVIAEHARRAPLGARLVAALFAVGTWLVVVGVATIVAPFVDGRDRSRCALVLATGAAVAALVAWLRANDETVKTLALTAATTSGLSAVAAVLTVLIPDGRSWSALAIVCAAVVAVGLRADHRWGRIPAAVAAAAGMLLAVPVAAAVAALLPAASRAWPHAWHLDASGSASAWAQMERAPTAPGALALHLVAAIALLMAARPAIGRRWLMGGLGAAGLVAVALAPVMLSISIAETAVLAIGAMVLCAVGALCAAPIGQRLGLGRSAVLRCSALGSVVAWSTAAIWSPASAWLTLTVVGSAVAAASVFAMVGRKVGDSVVAVPAAIALASALAVEVGFAFAAAGRSIEVAVATAGVAAVAFGVIAAMPLTGTRQHRDLDRRLSHWVEVTTWCIHAVVLAAVTTAAHDGAGLRLTLGAGAIAAGLHGRRPGRRLLLGLAATEGLLLVWVQLAALSVRLPEAYSLPLALVLLGAGLIAEHRAEHQDESVESWVTSGPGLVVGFMPTVLLSLNDPGLVRPLLGLVAGTFVLVAGALDRRKAPVDVGIAVAAVLGLRQLAPVAGELPNWATLGVAGTLLVAVGATFEQRRRDLRDVRLRYGQLR
ncbi:MAG: hypothetical protein ABIP03_10800 [Aquihabitans sp.]